MRFRVGTAHDLLRNLILRFLHGLCEAHEITGSKFFAGSVNPRLNMIGFPLCLSYLRILSARSHSFRSCLLLDCSGMRNQNLTKLAELIRDKHNDLMQLWRSKVQRVSGVRNLDTPEAAIHIAALLEDIGEALLKGKKKSLAALPVDEATEVHGVQRFNQGFNLMEVVTDYNALRETIQEFAEANRITVTGRVRGILDRILDKAIGVAVQTYSEEKNLEIQRQREEHLSFLIHDLKTPLSAVPTAAVILDRTLDGTCKNDRVVRMLEIVERNAKRLNALISRVIQEQTGLERTGA